MAILISIFDLALLFGAPTIGFLIDGFGYPTAFWFGGVLLVTGILAHWVWTGT